MKKRDIFTILAVVLFVGFLFNVSPTRAATLYYNAGTDTNWNTLTNWWTDAGFTTPAPSLPTTSDNVIISGNVVSNSGPAASVNIMTVNGTAFVKILVTVANGAIFNDSSLNKSSGGIVDGNATFNDSSLNGGIVGGNAIFNNTSSNALAGANVLGNATFNNSSNNNGGTISGTATFYNSSYNNGTVSGDAVFNDSTHNNDVGGGSNNFTFNDLSYNDGTFTSGNVVFNDSSHNNSTGGSGTTTFNDSSYNAFAGTVGSGGTTTFNGSSYNAGTANGYTVVFKDSSYNDTTGIATTSIVTNIVSFFDSTINKGAVTFGACFAATASPDGGSVGGATTVCPVSAPTVTTDSAEVLTTSSEKLFGTITDTGGGSANTIGFQYGRTATYGTTVSQSGAFVRQTFNSTIDSVACGDYHFRAFATNSAGTSYGDDMVFRHHACGNATGTGGGGTTTPPTCTSPEVLVNGACTTPPPPTCTSPQVLVNGVCTTPTPTCTAPQVLVNGACVTPPPTCTPPKVLVNGVCKNPTPLPTCISPQVLQNGVCVTPKPKPLPPPAPTPTPAPVGGTTTTTSSSTSGSNILGSVLSATREVTNNPSVRLVANVAMVVPIAASLIVLGAALLAGMPIANYLFYLFVVFSQILGFTKKPKPWGTVYDAVTKKPLPFARVEILNEQSRKLQSTVADANGRYGFLISNEIQQIQFQAHLTKYDFPALEQPSVVEQKLYPNIYKGGLVDVRGGQANYDLPMHPREKALVSGFYFGITSVKLNNLLVSAANVLFVIGSAFGISNAIVNPSLASYSILALIFVTFLIRVSGFKLKPFGLTKDTVTNKNLPFGLITLQNQNGERTNFTVSDEVGRYFLLTPKGNYTLKAFTPSHISPMRTKEMSISARKGWVSEEIVF